MKVLFDPNSGKLLGAQAVGEDGVDKRIDVMSTAIRNGMTVDELMDLELSYAPQFGSAKDAINIAGYVGNNVWNGTTPTIQWHELAKAIESGAQIIDVRSPAEHASGHIPDTVNIPVEQVRDRLSEFKRENVIVYCAVGQRGHIATQILKANGVEVRNLDGGYSTWSLVEAL
jgi:rhodanese-related sulfurtransferase